MSDIPDSWVITEADAGADSALPEATAEAVLAHPLPTTVARYDLVVGPASAYRLDGAGLPAAAPLVEAFARHGHRTFAIGAGGVDRHPEAGLVSALAELRWQHDIGAAAVLARTAEWGTAGLRARRQWGWRTIYAGLHGTEESDPGGRSRGAFQRLLRSRADVVLGDAEIGCPDGGRDTTGQCVVWPRGGDWADAWHHVDVLIRSSYPRASIVVVTDNNLPAAKLCLASVLANTEYPNYEIIVVDNGSTDGTATSLHDLADLHPHIRVVANRRQQGLALASNRGLAQATGEVLVLLGSDSVVPHGWLTRLARQIEHSAIGLLGPTTNRVAGEATIRAPYRTYGEFRQFARAYQLANESRLVDIPHLDLSCVAMRWDVYERLGPLDERYEADSFLGEDYALRARTAGYRVAYAGDVFVHQGGAPASSSVPGPDEDSPTFLANQRLYEDKWGISWEPRASLTGRAGQSLTDRIRDVVDLELPAGEPVIVADVVGPLPELNGRPVVAFPRRGDGGELGGWGFDGDEAVAQLEALRGTGASYFLVPQTASWWLERSAKLRQHLARRYPVVVAREDVCTIYGLRAVQPARRSSWLLEFESLMGEYRERFGLDPAILDWETGLGLRALFPQLAIFSPPTLGAVLPYLDHSVDLVAVRPGDAAQLVEARRVALAAVAIFRDLETAEEPITAEEGESARTPGYVLDVEWRLEPPTALAPTVSIVIPTHNGVAFTEQCLSALAATLPPDFRGEVIVVDDASTDATRSLLAHWRRRDPRLKVLCNPTNAGFVESCNRGALVATGEIVVFLNNDTIPQRGWLPPLLETFRNFTDAGAVGGKLIYPDGMLQEAGGVIFSDGSGANFGRGSPDPADPLFQYVREVDYCSGALLATKRALFLERGGFDRRFAPGYYEDTNYCFALRDRGYRVYYQPESVVVHVEGATAGTDIEHGAKRHQVANRAKFAAKWARALRMQPAPPERYDMDTWYELAVRGRGEAER